MERLTKSPQVPPLEEPGAARWDFREENALGQVWDWEEPQVSPGGHNSLPRQKTTWSSFPGGAWGGCLG